MGRVPSELAVEGVGYVYWQPRSAIFRNDYVNVRSEIVSDLRKVMRDFKRGLAVWRSPTEHPPNPIPIARDPYRYVMSDGSKGRIGPPGRLRRMAALGFKAKVDRRGSQYNDLRMKITWGITNEMWKPYLNYAVYVGNIPGPSSGDPSAQRWRWYVRFRKWLRIRMRQLVNGLDARARSRYNINERILVFVPAPPGTRA